MEQLILKCFNNSTFYNVVCISWKIKCWILLMHGVNMKFTVHTVHFLFTGRTQCPKFQNRDLTVSWQDCEMRCRLGRNALYVAETSATSIASRPNRNGGFTNNSIPPTYRRLNDRGRRWLPTIVLTESYVPPFFATMRLPFSSTQFTSTLGLYRDHGKMSHGWWEILCL